MNCCKVESRFSNLDSSGAEPLWILAEGETCEDIREDDVDYGDDEEDGWE